MGGFYADKYIAIIESQGACCFKRGGSAWFISQRAVPPHVACSRIFELRRCRHAAGDRLAVGDAQQDQALLLGER